MPEWVFKMGRLFWIKIWTEEWLDGSIREQLTAVERSIWVDLLVMAGRSRISGVIQSNSDTGYSHDYLANRFNISRGDLDKALLHFQEQERIIENKDGIRIINWSKYQNPKRLKNSAEKLTPDKEADGVARIQNPDVKGLPLGIQNRIKSQVKRWQKDD